MKTKPLLLFLTFSMILFSCVDVDEEEVTIEFDKQEILTTQSINFTDTSPKEPTNRTWTFEGGNPTTSSERTQIVNYQNSGVFKVTLELYYKSTNQTITKIEYIDVLEPDFSNGLVAYYPFNDNANDESEYNNQGYVDGPYIDTDRFGDTNSCYSFDGDDDIIRVYDSEELYIDGELTLSAWIYPKEIKSQQIIRKGACHVNGPFKRPWGLSLSGTNDMIFTVTTNEGTNLKQARKPGYDIETWYLITGVLKDGEMLLYINGELEATEKTNGHIIDDPLSMYIGTRLQLPSSTFNGKIDEIRIYDRALSESEVLYLYEKNI